MVSPTAQNRICRKTNVRNPRSGDERDGVASKECRRGIGNGCDTRSGVRLIAKTLALGVPRGGAHLVWGRGHMYAWNDTIVEISVVLLGYACDRYEKLSGTIR